MLRGSKRKLFVGLDEREHGVVVRRWVVACNVAVDTALSHGAALGKLLDQLVVQQLVCWRRLYELQKELRRCTRLFDATC